MHKIKELLILLNYSSESVCGLFNQMFNLNFPVLLINGVVDVAIDDTASILALAVYTFLIFFSTAAMNLSIQEQKV